MSAAPDHNAFPHKTPAGERLEHWHGLTWAEVRAMMTPTNGVACPADDITVTRVQVLIAAADRAALVAKLRRGQEQ